jgi:hypothetical protein
MKKTMLAGKVFCLQLDRDILLHYEDYTATVRWEDYYEFRIGQL